MLGRIHQKYLCEVVNKFSPKIWQLKIIHNFHTSDCDRKIMQIGFETNNDWKQLFRLVIFNKWFVCCSTSFTRKIRNIAVESGKLQIKIYAFIVSLQFPTPQSRKCLILIFILGLCFNPNERHRSIALGFGNFNDWCKSENFVSRFSPHETKQKTISSNYCALYGETLITL